MMSEGYNAIAIVADGICIVTHKQHCTLFGDIGEKFKKTLFRCAIEIGIGFIEQQKAWRGDKGAGKHGALQLTTAETRHRTCLQRS